MKYFTVIVLSFLPLLASSYYMKIGILSHDLDPDTTKKIWLMAQNYSTLMSLEPIVQMAQWRDIDNAAKVSRSICSLVKTGIDGLVFLGAPRWNSFISSYSTHLGLPFITALDNNVDLGKHQVCMLPDTSEVAADFIIRYGWNSFVFFYDSDNGPDQLQKILLSLVSVEFVPRIDGFWKVDSVDLALRYLQDLLSTQTGTRFLLATSEEFADAFVKSSGRCNVLLLTPVGTVPRMSNQGMNTLTKFSVVDAQDPVLTALENRLKTLSSFSARGRPGKDIPDSAILHYDSSSTLDTMFNQIARENPAALKSLTNSDCLEFSGEIPETADFLKKISVEHGATGKIKFGQDGRRLDYKLSLIQSSPYGIQKIGTWSDRYGLQLLRDTTKSASIPTYEAYRSDPPIRVTSILVEPFLYKNENGSFTGFVADFLDELSKEIKLNFDLQLVKDGYYGKLVNGEWKGMIGELVRGEAQLAFAPLTKTLERGKVIDFSKNILTTGLNILMKKQESDMGNSRFGPFTFLTIWSVETWIVIIVVVAIYSAGGYGISRFIGAPDRVRALETKGTDNLSPCGSVWFTVGSLFCRDTGIYPRNLTHRLWALLWWIFCIFISLLYVSMLTSTLIKVRTTVTTIHSRKTSQEMLKEFIDTGFPVIGTLRGGSTMSLFLKSELGMHQQYGRYLQENPDVLTNSYFEGVERVRKSEGKYAYIMESASSELIANKEPCDTLVSSGYLVTRPYAVAFPKNSTLKEIVDHGILSLMETGRVRKLYEKWWHSQSTTCEDPVLNILPEVYNTSMTLHEASGIFYLFILFSLLSVAVAAVEYYIRTRNIIVK